MNRLFRRILVWGLTAAALASSSYYGEKEDEYTRDPTYNSHNLVNLLWDAGFSGVETNKYYTIEKEEDCHQCWPLWTFRR